MKVLNLYAGIGGNRKLWEDVEVTAVENNKEIAEIYQDLFPDDKVVIEDAHEYLLNHFQESDFIWSSPPCPSHSTIRFNLDVRFRGTEPLYPDLKLYEEIIFLQHHCKTKFVVENVNPYYEPLIPPTVFLQRHCFWSNFAISSSKFNGDKIRSAGQDELAESHGINLDKYESNQKRKMLRNCTQPELGLHILNELLRTPTNIEMWT